MRLCIHDRAVVTLAATGPPTDRGSRAVTGLPENHIDAIEVAHGLHDQWPDLVPRQPSVPGAERRHGDGTDAELANSGHEVDETGLDIRDA